MTHVGILNPNSKWAREYNERNGGVMIARPFSLRDELNKAYTAQMMKANSVRGSRNPKDVAMRNRALASMADLREQLTLLDACEMGFIAADCRVVLNYGGAK
jgi:hypothetical protein